jgi:hypothetical protein
MFNTAFIVYLGFIIYSNAKNLGSNENINDDPSHNVFVGNEYTAGEYYCTLQNDCKRDTKEGNQKGESKEPLDHTNYNGNSLLANISDKLLEAADFIGAFFWITILSSSLLLIIFHGFCIIYCAHIFLWMVYCYNTEQVIEITYENDSNGSRVVRTYKHYRKLRWQ